MKFYYSFYFISNKLVNISISNKLFPPSQLAEDGPTKVRNVLIYCGLATRFMSSYFNMVS